MIRISKDEWTRHGGLSNPNLCRRMRSGVWHYYRICR